MKLIRRRALWLAIFDLGRGTFDVFILEVSSGVWR
jgi:molecular chaperone DnaK (HSP70)